MGHAAASVSRARLPAITARRRAGSRWGRCASRMNELRGLLDLVGAVVDRDRLQQHRAVGRRAAGRSTPKNVGKSPPADGLDHLERDERRRICRTGRGSRAPARSTRSATPASRDRGRVGVLLGRDRRRRDTAAARGRRVDGEAAPAGADLDARGPRRPDRACRRRARAWRSTRRAACVSGSRNTPREYIMVSSSISSKRSLPRS